jgi:hypothetical protein
MVDKQEISQGYAEKQDDLTEEGKPESLKGY